MRNYRNVAGTRTDSVVLFCNAPLHSDGFMVARICFQNPSFTATKVSFCRNSARERFLLNLDAFAINQNHWTFDKNQILGIFGPLNIPLEEYLFFIFIPMAAILTLEGVKVVLSRFSK